jgi:hypothetical protein
MKTSGLLAGVAMLPILLLQGCATSGGNPQNAQAAPAAVSQPSAAQMSPASKATGPAVTSIRTKSDFEAVQAAIQQQMQTGGRFSSVDPSGRAAVSGRLQDMATLFDQYGDVDKMDPTAMARLNDDQNSINAVLAARDGNRMVCHDEMPVGSHLPKRVCRTLSDIQNQQNSSQQTMRELQMKPSQIGGH